MLFTLTFLSWVVGTQVCILSLLLKLGIRILHRPLCSLCISKQEIFILMSECIQCRVQHTDGAPGGAMRSLSSWACLSGLDMVFSNCQLLSPQFSSTPSLHPPAPTRPGPC